MRGSSKCLLYHDLEIKEEVVMELEAMFQETKKTHSISTIKASILIEANMVKLSYKTLSPETFGDFEKNNRGIGSNLMMKMCYGGQGLGKEGQGTCILIGAQ